MATRAPSRGLYEIAWIAHSTVYQLAGGAKGIFNKLFSGNTHMYKSYKMVLIGPTGSGKTSFLNLLVNCGRLLKNAEDRFDENTVKDMKPYHVESAESPHAKQMESKTSEATVYELEMAEGVTLTIIDTPGFGDTGGEEVDKENAAKIVAALAGQEFIHCICLVINGRDSRMSPSLLYVLDEITAILPKDILNNVIVLFTNTLDKDDLNFDYNELTSYCGKPTNFFVDNPFCKQQKALANQRQINLKAINNVVPATVNTLEQVLTKVRDFKIVYTKTFSELFKLKQEVELKVLNLLARYDDLEDEETEVRKAQADVDGSETQKSNNDLKSKRQVKKTRVVDTKATNILCGARSCKSNCHEGCWLFTKSFGQKMIMTCEKFLGSKCKVCSHSYKDHYYNKGRYETYIENLGELKTTTRKELADQLLETVQKFKKLGTSKSYAKILKHQIGVIKQRLPPQGTATVTGDTDDLQAVKDELDKELADVKKEIQKNEMTV